MVRLIVILLVAIPLSGATQQTRPPEQRSDDPDYRRPTSGSIPPFRLDYFAGAWTFDWDVPDSIFGEGGTITGTETVTCGPDGKSCDSALKATGPNGSFTQTARLTYDETAHTMTRVEKDSRGFEVRHAGQLSSDQGFHQIAYTSSSFRYQGKTVQLKSSSSMTAPAAYRVRFQLSIDDGPFESFGNPWWRKASGPAPPPSGPGL
jgi:hypothetical protein